MHPRRSPLVLTALAMAGLALIFGVLMLVDPRVIEGAPAWLKPAKFAVSTGIYAATLAWFLIYLPGWPRLARAAGWTTAIVFAIEVVLIALQAARGTISHFNTSSPLDTVVFAVMGIAIGLQTVAAVAVAVALWRQTFTDRALGWALRLGMTLAVAGAFIGPLMTQPNAAQMALVRETGRMPRSGAHTVGGPDGGPGLPGTGWSTRHGDLRVPHFVGLHAMQVLPVVALLLGRRGRESTRVGVVQASAVAYTLLFAVLLAQALAGRPVLPMATPTPALALEVR